jgi:hypothetical protein
MRRRHNSKAATWKSQVTLPLDEHCPSSSLSVQGQLRESQVQFWGYSGIQLDWPILLSMETLGLRWGQRCV